MKPAGLPASKIREPGKEIGSPNHSHVTKGLASETNGKSHALSVPVLISAHTHDTGDHLYNVYHIRILPHHPFLYVLLDFLHHSLFQTV